MSDDNLSTVAAVDENLVDRPLEDGSVAAGDVEGTDEDSCCSNCGDGPTSLSSRGWCDGCEEEDAEARRHYEAEAAGDTQPAGEVTPASEAMPAVEAFAHAMAITAHQHEGATPEDATPAKPGRLPFPRPPFDIEKHQRRLAEKRVAIRELEVLVLRADGEVKRAKNALKGAQESLATANTELGELVDVLVEALDEYDGGEAEQLALHEPGRTPCAWEREHPGEVCTICSSGASHDTVADVTAAVADAVAAIVDEAAPAVEAEASPAPTEEPVAVDDVTVFDVPDVEFRDPTEAAADAEASLDDPTPAGDVSDDDLVDEQVDDESEEQ